MPSSGVFAETVEAIQDIGSKEVATIVIERAVVGLFFTGVKLSAGHVGACATADDDAEIRMPCVARVRLTQCRFQAKCAGTALSTFWMRSDSGIEYAGRWVSPR